MDTLSLIITALLVFLLVGFAFGLWGLLLSRSTAQARIKALDRALAEERANCADLRSSLHTCSETHIRAITEAGRERDELSEQVENLRHQIRVLGERPDRREMARLRACQELVRRLVLDASGPGCERAYAEVVREGRLLLVGGGPAPTSPDTESGSPHPERPCPKIYRLPWVKGWIQRGGIAQNPV